MTIDNSNEFLDRRNWNGPRKSDPTRWPVWLRQLARAIVDNASEVHFVQLEAADPINMGSVYGCDAAGSMTEWHHFLNGSERIMRIMMTRGRRG